MKKITKGQKEFLKKFECVRISDDIKYNEMTTDFRCRRNRNLVERLQSDAYNEDIVGATAHYLIIYNMETPVLYFVLKAGSLYTPLERDLQEMGEQILKKWKNKNYDDCQKKIQNIVKQVLDQSDPFPSDMINVCKQYKDLLCDVELERETQTIQVTHTYAGIELEVFCVNENARDIWKNANTFQTLGKTMYWSKIVPIFFNVQRLIGCKYCFLFAADSTKDETLVNYYTVDLKFKRMTNIGTPKPEYDFRCIPMFCDMSKLKQYQVDFFDNFNLDDNAELA